MLSVANVCSNARLAVSTLRPQKLVVFRHVRRMTTISAVAAKRKMVKVGTHNGTFHCDEALGCFLLQQTPTYKETDIVRSRSPDVLKDLDIVIDVGGVYDPSASLSMMHVSFAEIHDALALRKSPQELVSAGLQRYDHHQRGFEAVFGHGFVTKLSSAGLVYKHFGKQIVASALSKPQESEDVHTTWLAVYKYFMEAIDGIDNGVNQWQSDKPARYTSNTDLSSRVAALNPPWNGDQSEAASNAQFQKAMQLTGREFMEALNYYGTSWLPARALVQKAIDGRYEVDASGQIIKLPVAGCPWKEHLNQLEQELKLGDTIKFCIYEDTREHKWRVQTVPVEPGSFQSRKPLPKAWQGLRDKQLDEVSGIKACVFVHASGFIGGNATYEGVVEMAQQGLKLE